VNKLELITKKLHRRASNELHEIEDALQWLEGDQT